MIEETTPISLFRSKWTNRMSRYRALPNFPYFEEWDFYTFLHTSYFQSVV